MSREILFRGKRQYNGEWIYGDLQHNGKNIPKWVEGEEIIPETVGQFTGLTDKNGTMIFEGDIVKVKTEYVDETVYLVAYRDCGFKLIYRPSNGVVNLTNNKSRYIEVIGNIHDNPELMEKTK